MDGGRAGEVDIGGVPLDELAVHLVGSEEPEALDRLLWIGDHRIEQRAEMADDAASGLGFEQLGVEHEIAVQPPVVPSVKVQVEVELRRTEVTAQLVEAPGRIGREHRRLEGHDRLEERVQPGVALGLDGTHDRGERHDVADGLDDGAAHPAGGLREGGVAGQAATQHDRGERHSDDGAELRALAQVVRHTEDHLLLAGVAVEQDGIAGGEHLKEGDMEGARQGAEGFDGLGRDAEGLHAADKALDGRAGEVEGELQGGQIGELASPVVEPGGPRRAGHPLALPLGVVAVGHLGLGKGGLASG